MCKSTGCFVHFTRALAGVTSNRATFATEAYKKLGMTLPLAYHSLKSVLDELNDEKYKNSQVVKDLLTVYENIHEENRKLSTDDAHAQKHPFIVLEGLDGSGKSTVGARLAKKLGGVKCVTPPKSIGHLRSIYEDDRVLRTAYYSLGNYIAALEISVMLRKSPVVLDRYWHSTTAYSLAQAIQDFPKDYPKLPQSDDPIYIWPNDLPKPDIVLLLNVTEEVRLERHSRRNIVTTQESLLNASAKFRQDILTAYKNMKNPGVQLVDADKGFAEVLNEINDKVKHLFKKN